MNRSELQQSTDDEGRALLCFLCETPMLADPKVVSLSHNEDSYCPSCEHHGPGYPAGCPAEQREGRYLYRCCRKPGHDDEHHYEQEPCHAVAKETGGHPVQCQRPHGHEGPDHEGRAVIHGPGTARSYVDLVWTGQRPAEATILACTPDRP